MTKTYLLCLANSKKYGERCIAGVQLIPDAKNAFHPFKPGGKPKWLRPVSDSEHGQVPAHLVRDFAVGDILQFDLLRPCPSEYQIENCLFAAGSVQKVRPAVLTVPHLDQLVENQEDALLGNRGRSLALDEISKANRSLVLVKPNEVQPYFTTPYNTKPRVKFKLSNTSYDLPMTDVNFFDQMQEGLEGLNGQTPYITISLGVPFEGKYYKLAAGMVYCL
ncbi:MAG: hypothetical protein K9J37_08645 [Saprospiraceae bacterium]|nr:hypothetical protein [Saprospiraceae bacterium]MCF8249968.1 hypothetical protein [Saprospiraceae bacterium]MCF8278992.1 hypothetical protein [Bacteroidales bacterium]MCF8310981.1 hypothetical protein [Saprospiraceae bacterium]MCF8439683.1 hypothetical protein [Saprospiraceae bacterium]